MFLSFSNLIFFEFQNESCKENQDSSLIPLSHPQLKNLIDTDLRLGL